MFSHIMVGSNNIELSKKFYDCILGTLGYKEGVIDEKGRCFYVNKTGIFAITQPIDGNESTHANGGTIGFSANSQEEVNNWHKIGLANGGTECEEPPGIRESGFGPLYLAYLRDPFGNKVCALHMVKS